MSTRPDPTDRADAQAATPADEVENPRVLAVELMISRVLRLGVLISLFLMAIGVGLGAIQTARQSPAVDQVTTSQPADMEAAATQPASLEAGQAVVPSLTSLPVDFLRLDGRAWMTAGLLVLIFTPVIRVAMSILLFMRMRDKVFTLITIFVLTMLIISFFLGHGK